MLVLLRASARLIALRLRVVWLTAHWLSAFLLTTALLPAALLPTTLLPTTLLPTALLATTLLTTTLLPATFLATALLAAILLTASLLSATLLTTALLAIALLLAISIRRLLSGLVAGLRSIRLRVGLRSGALRRVGRALLHAAVAQYGVFGCALKGRSKGVGHQLFDGIFGIGSRYQHRRQDQTDNQRRANS